VSWCRWTDAPHHSTLAGIDVKLAWTAAALKRGSFSIGPTLSLAHHRRPEQTIRKVRRHSQR